MDAGLDPTADADRVVACVARHRVAFAVALGIMARIIDLDQRDDRPGHAVLRDEVDDLL